MTEPLAPLPLSEEDDETSAMETYVSCCPGLDSRGDCSVGSTPVASERWTIGMACYFSKGLSDDEQCWFSVLLPVCGFRDTA